MTQVISVLLGWLPEGRLADAEAIQRAVAGRWGRVLEVLRSSGARGDYLSEEWLREHTFRSLRRWEL